MTDNNSIAKKTMAVNISSLDEMKKFSNDLKSFVVNNKLYSPIKGKNYVHVEGWQFAGAAMGLFPIVEKVEDLSTETGEFKYRAEVAIQRLSDGMIISRGVATCSNKERKKRDFDEYAIASMAQTRATGKAFRIVIGWVMKLAGYEPTPSEEMDKTLIEAEEVDKTEDVPIAEVKIFVDGEIAKLNATDKIKFLKQVGKLSENNLDDLDYRRLFAITQKEADDEHTS